VPFFSNSLKIDTSGFTLSLRTTKFS